VTDGANRQKSFEKLTVPLAREKRMGIIAMKALGAGALLREKAATVEDALRYVWTLPVSTAILGASEPDHVRLNARLAASWKPLSRTAMEERRRRAATWDLARMEPWRPAAV
jgi:aryl-alcohol dehydrogenase-like predicted oxidoreductase